MAVVNRTAGLTSTLDASMGEISPSIYDYEAGEAIESGQPVTLTGGVLMRAGGTANIMGFAGRTVRAGQKLTVFGPGARFGGFTGLTPGTLLYVDAAAGSLNDATGGVGVGTRPVARAITATDVQVIGFY
jgi:hypothetical protein